MYVLLAQTISIPYSNIYTRITSVALPAVLQTMSLGYTSRSS